MANAKKCDLCEKYYEPYGKREPGKYSYIADTIEANSIDITYSEYDYPEDSWDYMRPVSYVRDHFDLCPECRDRITEFIESLKRR